ncbi:MAG: protein kinase domain-containing protein, partial [Verrucomicrobiales bacterium]
EQNLDTSERLALFVDVCHAVQHAHQKGVIHRDLKPSNVMVTMHDDRPVVKVIDFGVAKATQTDLTDKTLFTQFEQFIGTPAYMSPEQAQFSGLDIDTRSDIYTLGVLLYELLTGTTPFDSKSLAMAGQDEIRRIIKEEEPARPSARLSTLGNAELTSLAKHRQVQPTKLPGLVRGDLDWIVMKALEKDRTRRYETANALAADVNRHLNDEPVTAAAPSASYRLAKFARKYRPLITTAAVIALALIAGTGVSLWQAAQARDARDTAELASSAERSQRERAQHQERITSHNYVEELLSSGQSALGIAHLAKLIREDPANTIAAERLLSAIRDRELPTTLSTFGDGVYVYADLSEDQSMLVTVDQQGTIQVRDRETGRPLGVPMHAPGEGSLGLDSVNFAPPGDQRIFVARAGWQNPSATAAVFDWKTGELIAKPVLDSVAQSALVSPDGKLVLLGCPDTAVVWDIANDAPAFDSVLEDLDYSAVFSPDSQLILSASGKLFDTSSGRLIRTFECPSQNYTLKFDPTGTRIAGGAWDGIARIWEATSGTPLGEMPHPDNVFDATFDSDGTRLITACKDGVARIWDSRSFELIRQLPHGDVELGRAYFATGGRQAVTATVSGDFYLWDLGRENTPPTRFNGESFMQQHKLDRDGRSVLSYGGFNSTRLRSVPRLRPKSQIVRHQEVKSFDWGSKIVSGAVFSPSGDRFVTAAVDATLMVWDSATSLPQFELHLSGALKWNLEFSSDGSLIMAVAESGIAIWDSTDGTRLASLSPSAIIQNALLSPARDPDGNYLIATIPDRGTTGQLYKILHNDAPGQVTVIQPLGLTLDGVDIGFAGGEFLHASNRMAFSPDATRVAATATGGSARVWGTGNGELQLTLSGAHRQRTESVAFSPDGGSIATTSLDGTAALWSSTSGDLIAVLPHGHRPVNNAEFSPDSTTLITTSADGTARLWDTATTEPIGLTLQHDRLIRRVTFSPDSARILTASLDGSARIWDAKSGLPLSAPLRHDGFVISGEFSPDGNRVVTAGNDGTARLWDVPPAPPGPVPGWVHGWAEAVAGRKINDDDTVTLLRPEEMQQIRDQVLALPLDDFYAKTAQWFYADHTARPITPFSKITTRYWIENRISENNTDSIEQALRIAPDNPRALAAMAQLKINGRDLRVARQLATRLPAGKIRVDFLSEIESLSAQEALLSRVKQLNSEARAAASSGDFVVAQNLARAAALGLALAHIDEPFDWVSPKISSLLAEVTTHDVMAHANDAAIVPANATWQFLDDDRRPAPGWTTAASYDSTWKSGSAPFGFGKFTHTTQVAGEDTSNVAYYFRHQFELPGQPASGAAAVPPSLRIRCDDAAAVYLNGIEIARINLPAGELTHDTQAVSVNGGRR